MVPDVAVALLAGGYAAALGLVVLVLAGTRRYQVYAHPNERSFHDLPKPTAGGIGFVVPVVGYLAWVAAAGAPAALMLAAGGTALAAVGLWDDVREVSPLLRMPLHLLAAGGVVAVAAPDWPWWLMGAGGLALAWQINLYNFMDGIDGIAGSQAMVFLAGTQIIAGGVPGWSGDLAWLACGGTLGFLVFNFPPARLFMGDVGSGFLGFLTGALAILWWQQGLLHLVPSLILLAVFWLDASYTLIVRFITGQPFTQAHRSHLYQKVAATRGHSWTTAAFLLYAIFWLLPLAWLSASFPDEPGLLTWLWLVAAGLPVLIAAWRFRAGMPATLG